MELAYQPARELARMIREREISAEALLEHFLARVERLNPAINAVVGLEPDAARRRAREADAALARGENWGPLHGVPMTVKDSFEIAGMTTTAGAKEMREHRADTNAAAVQRLVDAGAIVYGRTNVPLYTGDLQTYNDVYGTTNNPWAPDRTTGGSSGGAAAALAAGLTPLELGSDLAGSIRIPAHCCGVFGHKPSYGIVSTRGHIPGPPGTLRRPDISVAGPLARNAEDLALAMELLVGPDPEEATGWRLELPQPRKDTLTDYRIAAWLDDSACPIDHDSRQLLEGVVERIRGAGIRVDDQARPRGLDLRTAYDVFYPLMTATVSADLPPKILDRAARAAEEAAADDNSYAARFARAASLRHSAWQQLDEKRQRLRRAWADFFQTFDAVLCPVAFSPAFPHDHSQPVAERTIMVNGSRRPYMDVVTWVGLAGAAYLPATVIPIGRTRSGLPVGMQIVGPYLEDRTTLDIARHLEALLGGFTPPVGY